MEEQQTSTLRRSTRLSSGPVASVRDTWKLLERIEGNIKKKRALKRQSVTVHLPHDENGESPMSWSADEEDAEVDFVPSDYDRNIQEEIPASVLDTLQDVASLGLELEEGEYGENEGR